MDYQDVYLLAGLYESTAMAEEDFDRISEAHARGMIGKFQAAVFEKRPDGKVKVINTTSTSRATGSRWGLAVGAAIGLLFPPALLVTAAEGAAVGAAAGNLSKGWFKGDIKRMADALQPGQAGVVAVAEAESTIDATGVLTTATMTHQEQVTGADAEEFKERLRSEEQVAAGV